MSMLGEVAGWLTASVGMYQRDAPLLEYLRTRFLNALWFIEPFGSIPGDPLFDTLSFIINRSKSNPS